MERMIAICFGIFFLVSGCSSLQEPKDEAQAKARIIHNSFYKFDKNTGKLSLISMHPNETTIVSASNPCKGAAGSLVNPLARHQCTTGILFTPLNHLADHLGALFSSESSYRKTVELKNVERHWVQQDAEDLCWAATLEMARNFLRLSRKDQREIARTLAESRCEDMNGISMNKNKGASTYQISYALGIFESKIDRGRIRAHFCSDENCIINAIRQQRPVIMLKEDHALLLAKIVYEDSKEKYENDQFFRAMASRAGIDGEAMYPYIMEAYALDPRDKDTKWKKLEPIDLCAVNAFIVL